MNLFSPSNTLALTCWDINMRHCFLTPDDVSSIRISPKSIDVWLSIILTRNPITSRPERRRKVFRKSLAETIISWLYDGASIQENQSFAISEETGASASQIKRVDIDFAVARYEATIKSSERFDVREFVVRRIWH